MRASAAKCVKKTLDIFLPEALIATPAVLQKRNKLACIHFFLRGGWPLAATRKAGLGWEDAPSWAGLNENRPDWVQNARDILP